MFVEARKAGFTIFQGSYTNAAVVERRYIRGEWQCGKGAELDRLRKMLHLPVSSKQLATILYQHTEVDADDYRVRFLHPQKFTAGELPSLILFEQGEQLKASLRVQNWKPRPANHEIFEIEACSAASEHVD